MCNSGGGDNLKHIVFYSGGLGSWMTAKRVIDRFGSQNVICLFTDTLIEDEDLYRFILETTQHLYGVDQTDLINRVKDIPETSHLTMDSRKNYLAQLAADTNNRNPNFMWLNDGRDPWDVFKEVRFLGNSKIARCSHELKQKMAADWIYSNYNSEECILYLGIDWTEEHRTKAPRKNWLPYKVEYPMCEEPLITKVEVAKQAEKENIKPCRMYDEGFSHANCGGFCVRGGHGHFANLYEKKPNLFRYHEEKEQEMRDFLNKDVSILSKTKTINVWVDEYSINLCDLSEDSELLEQYRKGLMTGYEVKEGVITVPGHYETKDVKTPFTLRELRKEIEKGGAQLDLFDIGGCGCFVDN